jgi:hypothetical protein
MGGAEEVIHMTERETTTSNGQQRTQKTHDERLSLYPLTEEEALRRALSTGPLPHKPQRQTAPKQPSKTQKPGAKRKRTSHKTDKDG